MTRSKALARLVAYAPPVIAAHAKPQPRCVLATRIGLDVLSALGIAAAPMPVVLDAANAAYFEWCEAGEPDGFEGYRARRCWLMSNDPRKRGLQLRRAIANPWPGHLVLRVQDQIVDLDLQQLARPAFGITPPPALMLPWPSDQPAALATFEWGAVAYRRWPETHMLPEYQQSVDWRGPYDHIVKPLVRAIRRGVTPS
jgi:hypothetical protein